MNKQLDVSEIQNRLVELIKEIIDDDSVEIDPQKSLIEVYGLDSLDLLDFSFNIEDIYNVKIGKDELSGRAKGRIDKDEIIDENGNISETALEELRTNIPEIPSEKIKYGLRPGDIIRLLNVAVFTRLVYDKLTNEE